MKQREPIPQKSRNLQHCKMQELQKEIVNLAKKDLSSQSQRQVLDVFNETSRRIAEIKTYDFSKFSRVNVFL